MSPNHDPPAAKTVPSAKTWSLSTLRHDLPASIVVFLVAIPLSLGIALASGAPITAGLVAAAVGGLVAGAAGGSALQVSGPAAGLTVVVAELVQTFGWAATCAITLAAGALQVGLGLMRVGRAALAISPAIVYGMLAGIGITIVFQQVHVMLGGKSASSANANIAALPGAIDNLNPWAIAVGVLVIAVLIVWPRISGRLGVIPAPLLAIVLATAGAMMLDLDIPRVSLPDDLLGSFVGPAIPDTSVAAVGIAVVTVALIASIESLLSAVAVDKQHNGARANLDRELTGQGLANMLSGALGGLPITGVIVRSSTNVAAGARTRASAMLHGLWVIVFSLLAVALLEQIPLAALAGLLVMIGVKMVDPKQMRVLRRHRQFALYVITAFGVVELNLMEGVILGVGSAILLSLFRLTHTKIRTEHRGDHWHVTIDGSLTFVSVPRLSKALTAIPAGTSVDVDLRVDYLDHAAFEALHSWRLAHERMGGDVDIDEIHESWYEKAAGGAPQGTKSTPATPWFLPLQRNRDDHAIGDRVMRGALEYQREAAPRLRPVFKGLVDGQSPSQLFITCADSRLMPHLITGTGPGDLFMARNVGNLVPQHGDDGGTDSSVGATIEYATEVLEVDTITVCGHSSCGAMGALLAGRGKGEAAGALDAWLRHGTRSLDRLAEEATTEDDRHVELERLCHANVAQQLENLMTYPSVRSRVEAGNLKLAGMYFDIATAQVYVFDHETGRFSPVDQTREPHPQPAEV